MTAFQSWMDLANANAPNPIVARAQVITQLYVSFVWLRDSLMTPVQSMLPGSTVAAAVEFLSSAERRHLRNAVAHGRWTYLSDFSGLEYWDGLPLRRLIVLANDLGAWQMLSRATSIAILLALTDEV